MSKEIYFQEDPTENSEGFYFDVNDLCYFDKEGNQKIYCQFHTRTQLKNNDGWFFCPKCEKEVI